MVTKDDLSRVTKSKLTNYVFFFYIIFHGQYMSRGYNNVRMCLLDCVELWMRIGMRAECLRWWQLEDGESCVRFVVASWHPGFLLRRCCVRVEVPDGVRWRVRGASPAWFFQQQWLCLWQATLEVRKALDQRWSRVDLGWSDDMSSFPWGALRWCRRWV
jgi:hypothetical protein